MDEYNRILGIDFGTKRIGVAISDPLGITAQGLETIELEDCPDIVGHIASLVTEHSVKAVVVGRPVRMDGTVGSAAKNAGKFALLLKKELNIPIHLRDERLTTAEAQKAMIIADVSRKKRKKSVDRIAAQLILQGWMDSRK